MVRPFLEDVYSDRQVEDRWLERLVALIRDDMTRLSDAVELSEWALTDTFAFSHDAERALETAQTRPVLARLVAELAHVVLLDEQTARSILQSMQRSFAGSFHWQAREVYWPIRAALTGRVRGPALHEVMALLGKGRCLERAAAILRTA
jgi:glutamyl/glutaminyl-tRNA synthetase